jgi:hypothetical protein
MASFDITAVLRPGEDATVIGTATSVHCLECYQFHFIAATSDGRMEDSDGQGQPLSAAGAADFLLECLSGTLVKA